MICEVLCVAYEDSPTVHESSKKMVQLSIEQDEKVAAHALHGLLARHMEAKRTRPDNGLLSRLVNTHVDEKGDLTFEQAVGLGVLVIGAGHETTPNMIALGIRLVRSPAR